MRILLVEDDPASQVTSAALLEDAGFDVETASSLAESRQLLLAERSYALVLLDFNLGDGRGLELIPVVRERLPGCKIVLLSGDFLTHSMPGVDGAFEKLGDFRELLQLIHKLFQDE